MQYQRILEEIRNHAKNIGRNPEEIKLVAVTKGRTLEEVTPLIEAGAKDLGENREKEALFKMGHFPSSIRWHFIGTLQRNKVQKVLGKFHLIHSVDTLPLAEKIGEASVAQGIKTAVLLQVNTSGEASKHGLNPEDWRPFLEKVLSHPGLSVQGLMTMAPLTEDEAIIRRTFSSLRAFRDEWGLRDLSMGMSHDYKIAIEEGATILRIGSLLFS